MPAEIIVDYAQKGGFDLIVMGTHGRTGLKHLLLGSVAEQVLRRALCPVLTTKAGAGGSARVAPAPMHPEPIL
jgi:nucleotide-binding universal stress UspA family protein